MNSTKAKPLFSSSTVRGATVTAIATIIVGIVTPVRTLIIDNHCVRKLPGASVMTSSGNVESANTINPKALQAYTQCVNNIDNVIQIGSVILTALGLGGAGTAVYGRVAVGDIWTPNGIPGPNQEDFDWDDQDHPAYAPPPRPTIPTRTPIAHNSRVVDDPTEGL